MATSNAPETAPIIKIKNARGQNVFNKEINGTAAQKNNAADMVKTRLPKRTVKTPVKGMANNAPTAAQSKAAPSVALSKRYRCCTSGIRATQLANVKPLIKKKTATDKRVVVKFGVVVVVLCN